jgi:hypothetical protein
METWKNVKGSRLSNLQADDRFPNKPDDIATLKTFDTGKDRMDNYGAKVSGFFRVCKFSSFTYYVNEIVIVYVLDYSVCQALIKLFIICIASNKW